MINVAIVGLLAIMCMYIIMLYYNLTSDTSEINKSLEFMLKKYEELEEMYEEISNKTGKQ